MRDFERGLTAERLRAVLEYEPTSGNWTWRRTTSNRAVAGRPAGKLGKIGYVRIGVDGHRYLAHRLAWLYMTGEWPSDEIDHKDTDGSNNRWNNLRAATSQQNKYNLSINSRNKLGLKGVCFDPRKGRYRASIRIESRQKFLGYFESPDLAHEAYAAASRQHFGDFARTT
jgi:hypothetical protein